MKRLIAAFLVLLFAGIAAAQTPSSKTPDLNGTLQKLETQGWELFKNKDKKWGSLCVPEYTGVFSDGSVNNLSQALQAMTSFTINHYALSDMKVVPLGPNAAVVNYKANVNITGNDGKPQDEKLAVTSVWVKRGGQWKNIRYHESPTK